MFLKKPKLLFLSYKQFNVKRVKVLLINEKLNGKNYYILRFYGPLGSLDYKFYELFFPLTDAIFYFSSKKFLKVFVSFYRYSHRSLCLGFFVQFSFSGVGFRFWKLVKNQKSNNLIKNYIFFSLGYSHFFSVKLTNDIFIYYKKPKFCLFSFDKRLLSLYIRIIEKLRTPDPYKLKGILLKGKEIIKKQGKQR